MSNGFKKSALQSLILSKYLDTQNLPQKIIIRVKSAKNYVNT